jgi:glycosyltransferase involved in cell wall biosynthesis
MTDWITAQPNPSDAHVVPGVRLFAVLGTWMEADIVVATIRNALTQGCERVYLVDNGSTDGTIDVAMSEGAILARSFVTARYDEGLRLQHMNAVVSEASASEGDNHIWWLFLDADEFPHGPFGMTMKDYVGTLDKRFRVVGMRFLDHYPSTTPTYVSPFHPLDFQPLCEELAFPMCPNRHRKHSLQRFDKGGAPIRCDRGFHIAHCTEPLVEPSQPAFLHHFPFRQREVTSRRLEALWSPGRAGAPRASDMDDIHMLTRYRSLDAAYTQDWASIHNFLALDPMNGTEAPRVMGVSPSNWTDLVEVAHQHVARWYSMVGAWPYLQGNEFRYGDDVTYRKGMSFLAGHGLIEDWGCGFSHARAFVTASLYRGIDGSSPRADVIVDLREYRSDANCIFMRHVLEHNADWRRILANAVASFRKRMVLVIFTPFAESTRQVKTTVGFTSVPVPDISFCREDLTSFFQCCTWSEESVRSDTEYGIEHVFYLEKRAQETRDPAAG